MHQAFLAGILFGWCTDIAKRMRQMFGFGIDAGCAHIHGNTRQVGCIHLNRCHFLPAQEFAQDHGHEAAITANIAFDPRLFMILQGHDAGEGFDSGSDISRLFRDQKCPPIQPIARHHIAAPIQNTPARRGEKPGTDAVFFCQGRVAPAFFNLQAIQPMPQKAERAQLHHAEQRGAARENAAPAFFFALDVRIGAKAGSAAPGPELHGRFSARRIPSCARDRIMAMGG